MPETPDIPAPPRLVESTLPTSEIVHSSFHRRRKLFAMTALAFSAVYIVADNVAPYLEVASTMHDAGPMVEDVEGCPHFPDVTTMPMAMSSVPQETAIEYDATLKIEAKFAPTKSAAEKFEPKKFNAIAASKDWADILTHEVAGFTSQYSGVEFHIFSDEEDPFVRLDTDVLDELIHASFSDEITFDHVAVRALMDCMRHRFIDLDGPRELQGERVNLYIPSREGVCWSNGLIQDKPPEADYDSFCDSVGATYTDLQFKLGPFEHQESWMVFMSSVTEPTKYPQKLAKGALHESGHLWTQFAGMPFKFIPNEALAKYIEVQTIEQVYDGNLPSLAEYR